jgi:hypothetical protein
MTARPITVSLLGEPVAFARMRIAARSLPPRTVV